MALQLPHAVLDPAPDVGAEGAPEAGEVDEEFEEGEVDYEEEEGGGEDEG